MFWRDFFFCSKADRRVLVVLVVLALVSSSVLLYKTIYPTKQERLQLSTEETDSFMNMVRLDTARMRREHYDRKKYERYEHKNDEKASVALNLHAFNPNTADSIEFLQLGFSKFVVHNILSYRRKGGVFRKAEKLSTIYGMTPEMFERAKPYISIAPPVTELTKNDTTQHKPMYTPVKKLAEGTVVDLNTADTTLLKQIPGIGSAYARAIVRYREQLGGYVSVSQLNEIPSIPSNIHKWFAICDVKVYRKINVNKSGIEQLTRHPYINFYQAKAIVEYRRRRGNLKSITQLSLLDEFPAKDIERMKPYLCY